MNKLRFHSMVLTALACALLTLPAMAGSQVRIVRLSDVQGGVQIDKNSGLGFENAFLNLPVTQGTQLRTRNNGRAEIEFEDGSTMRLTPGTTVEFGTLGLSDAGNRISAVNLVEGRAYVNWLGKNGDKFTLNFSQEKVELTEAAHFRAAISSGKGEIASFKNEVEVVGPSGTVKVDKKKMVAFIVDDNDRSMVAKNFATDTYDDWDKQSIEYHDQYAKNNSTPLGFGSSDLNYYGGYSNVPGYGMMWQPYFAGVGWNPFMDGAWSWYPGMGYMWTSAYPWGWLPYYCGNWIDAPLFGWGWQPGGCNSWQGVAPAVVTGLRVPAKPAGTVSTVVVGRGGPILAKNPALSLTVNRGSAGLGIARGSVSDLRHLNAQVAKTGSAQAYAAPQFSASSARAGGYGFGGEHLAASSGEAGHVGAGSSGHASGGSTSGHH
jgi:hypothetical protein